MKSIKHVLVAGRLTRQVTFEKWENMAGLKIQVGGLDGKMRDPEIVNPQDMPKEVSTTVKGAVKLLKKRGCQVDIAQTYEEAKKFLEKNDYDGVIVDSYLPSLDQEVGRHTLNLIGVDKDTSIGMQVAGILLAHELANKVWGVILDTEAITEGAFFLIAHGVKPVEHNLRKTLQSYEERTRGGWKWICNCDDCAVAAFFREI